MLGFFNNYFVDVNECAEETHNCHVMSNATCSDTDGSFYCNCTEGFEGNGTYCKSIYCFAFHLYLMSDCAITVDVDECQFEDMLCDSHATCFDTYGSYFCTCDTGFTGNGSVCFGEIVIVLKLCSKIIRSILYVFNTDINECTTLGLDACHPNATCNNTVGNYSCVCDPGFAGDGFNNCNGTKVLNVRIL